MAVSHEVKERIIAAANSLYERSPTGEYPTVEAVRQESRAAMSTVVEVMKGWRESQRKQVQVVREPLPIPLQEHISTLGQSFWETAQQLANESLDAARAGFEAEKSDLLQLSAEQSAAFEQQAMALEAAQDQIAALEEQLALNAEISKSLTQQLEATRQQLQAAEQATALAQQRCEDTERRAAELRTELDHAHMEAEQSAAAAQQLEDALRSDADRLRTERDRTLQRLELAEREQEKQTAQLVNRDETIQQLHEMVAKLTATAEAATQAHAADRERLEHDIDKLAGKLERRDSTLQQLRESLATATAQAVAAAQNHATERERMIEEAKKQAERLDRIEAEYETARQEAATARETAAVQRGELETTRGLLATFTAQLGHGKQ
ncbi:TPA: KfrA protein [Aeromonas hydrophila]|nr:KfrA protein [Aeromonas hydrophila]